RPTMAAASGRGDGCWSPGDMSLSFVMAGLDPAIHVFVSHRRKQDVDARDKPAHDEGDSRALLIIPSALKVRSFLSQSLSSSQRTRGPITTARHCERAVAPVSRFRSSYHCA